MIFGCAEIPRWKTEFRWLCRSGLLWWLPIEILQMLVLNRRSLLISHLQILSTLSALSPLSLATFINKPHFLWFDHEGVSCATTWCIAHAPSLCSHVMDARKATLLLSGTCSSSWNSMSALEPRSLYSCGRLFRCLPLASLLHGIFICDLTLR